jgi:ABC-2 type transport system ATP-binding protein
MNQGRLIEVAALDEIRDAIGVGTTLHVTVDQQPKLTLSDLEAMDDVTNAEADGPDLTLTLSDSTAKARVVSRIEEAGATVTDFETTESSLEDLFAELIDEDEAVEEASA